MSSAEVGQVEAVMPVDADVGADERRQRAVRQRRHGSPMDYRQAP